MVPNVETYVSVQNFLAAYKFRFLYAQEWERTKKFCAYIEAQIFVRTPSLEIGPNPVSRAGRFCTLPYGGFVITILYAAYSGFVIAQITP